MLKHHKEYRLERARGSIYIDINARVIAMSRAGINYSYAKQ
ncbi:unnamed protein product [Acidithrix sp. C25]|nr:unnamed protein product [Acidithrix sp. C25]